MSRFGHGHLILRGVSWSKDLRHTWNLQDQATPPIDPLERLVYAHRLDHTPPDPGDLQAIARIDLATQRPGVQAIRHRLNQRDTEEILQQFNSRHEPPPQNRWIPTPPVPAAPTPEATLDWLEHTGRGNTVLANSIRQDLGLTTSDT